uniref:Uncharacterized protein n=1 Tax=Oryza barthii TaxID=65489 RepID=A0A0D3GK89_9ORYZ
MIDTSFSKEAMRKLMGEEAHYRPSYKGMRLVTLQSKEKAARLKSLRAMNKTVENMRTKIGMKNNVIRKLPKNCPY